MSNTIKSNNDYLKEQTGIILTTLSTVDENSLSSKESYSSTTNCPPKEPPIVDAFLASCKELFYKIKNEVNLINEIGDGIAELDNVMKDKATTLDIELSSNIAANVDVKDFEKIDMPLYDEIDKQIDSVAAAEGINLNDLEMPHDSYEYGKVYGNNGGRKEFVDGNFDLYNGYGKDKLEENKEKIQDRFTYNYGDNYGNPDGEYNSQEETNTPQIVDGLYRTITPNIGEKNDSQNSGLNENKEQPQDVSPFDILVNPKNLSSKIIPNDSEEMFVEMKDIPEIKEVKKSSAGAIAAASGIGLATAASYGVNKYNKSKKEEPVKEYTVEEYEKEVKENGYNI